MVERMNSELATMAWNKPGKEAAEAPADDPTVDLLLVRARRGDHRAFEALLARHDRQVLGTAWRLLGRTEDARDAAQEVFLRLYRSLSRLDPERPLAAWLYRVTVNVCRDLRRGSKHHDAVPLDAFDLETLSSPITDDPAHRAVAREDKRIVAEGLALLGMKERAALVLRDVEGLDTNEVAEILGSSAATVRSQICHARLKLAKHRQQRLRGESS